MFALAERFGELTVTCEPDEPIDPDVDVRLTVPVAAFVVTFAELIDALEVSETTLVVPVPTVPASPRDPLVAVRLMLEPTIELPPAEFKLPAATTLNTPLAPELPLIVVVPALLSVM